MIHIFNKFYTDCTFFFFFNRKKKIITMENTSFIEITNQYRQQKRHQNMFMSNCSLFLTFEHTTVNKAYCIWYKCLSSSIGANDSIGYSLYTISSICSITFRTEPFFRLLFRLAFTLYFNRTTFYLLYIRRFYFQCK